jgi:hypothetical protein
MTKSQREQHATLKHPHLLLCEGLDAKYFLIWFLQHIMKDPVKRSIYNDFQVDEYGGIAQLRDYLKLLPQLPGFSDNTNTIKSITIIRDAETDARAASQSVRDALQHCKFAAPASPCEIAVPTNEAHKVNVAYALFPSFNCLHADGTLEDLCLHMLLHTNKDAILEIADSAVSSTVAQVGVFSRKHKNRLYTYLSLTNAYVGLKIGESAKAQAFDFSAKNLEPLKKLLWEIAARSKDHLE